MPDNYVSVVRSRQAVAEVSVATEFIIHQRYVVLCVLHLCHEVYAKFVQVHRTHSSPICLIKKNVAEAVAGSEDRWELHLRGRAASPRLRDHTQAPAGSDPGHRRSMEEFGFSVCIGRLSAFIEYLVLRM